MDDLSGGWEAIADAFVAARSDIGADVVARWSQCLRPGASIVDIGCGSGIPIARTLIGQGFRLYGIDASPTLIAAFRQRFPGTRAACEAAQTSRFFDRGFEGAVAVGLLFLLNEEAQRQVIDRVGTVLSPGGRFLFSAPHESCTWTDILTGRSSLSLGRNEYERLLAGAGLSLVETYLDEGQNHYYDAVQTGEGRTAS